MRSLRPINVLGFLLALISMQIACPFRASGPAESTDVNDTSETRPSDGTTNPPPPIVGEFAGMLIGPQTRSDGINFDTAWIVRVRFDEAGNLTAVSEIFDTGETLAVSGVGVPIHREESGWD